MNIVVLSPNCRGVGVTSVAYLLAAELKHKGEFVQLLDLNSKRPGLLSICRSIPKLDGTEYTGMTNLVQLIRTSTLTSEDMNNCAVDAGVSTICVTPEITDAEIIELPKLTKACQISGRNLYTVIDLNTDDTSSDLFKNAVKEADMCVFVLTQDLAVLDTVINCAQTNDSSMRQNHISTMYVVNRYEECALNLKSIWNKFNVQDKKCWFKLAYNKHIMQAKSLGLHLQLVDALHDSLDADVSVVKADISRIASHAIISRMR